MPTSAQQILCINRMRLKGLTNAGQHGHLGNQGLDQAQPGIPACAGINSRSGPIMTMKAITSFIYSCFK